MKEADEPASTGEALTALARDALRAIGASLRHGIAALKTATDYIVANFNTDVRTVALGAVPFLHLLGTVAGGWVMARSALVAASKISAGETDPFFPAKIITARYFAEHSMVAAPGLAREIVEGGASGLALADGMF